jgi:glycosyltransferase involved in cell wall biosynthesis
MIFWLMQLGEPIPIRDGVRKHRLTLLSEELVKRGHEVIRWGSAFDHITKTMLADKDTDIELAPNYLVKLIKGLGYRHNISLRRYWDHFLIDAKMIKIAKTMPAPDMILVATPPPGTAYKVVKFARKNNIPVIVDVRDQWPGIFIHQLPKMLQRFGHLLFFWEFYKLRRALAGADAVTAVMKEMLEIGLKEGGRKQSALDKVFYIGTRPAEDFEITLLPAEIQQLISLKNGVTIFTFVGTFGNFYNPAIIVDVAKRLQQEGREDIFFLFAGSGDNFEEVKSKALNLHNVHLLGWLHYEEMMALLKGTDVGICPLNKYSPFFPNKVFVYLSAFLPVISSTPGEFEHLMKTHNLGLYYHAGNAEELYNAVISLADNKELRMTMKNNVRKVFSELFDAEGIYRRFADHIESFTLEYKLHNPSGKRKDRIREPA